MAVWRSASRGEPVTLSSARHGWRLALAMIGMAILAFALVFQREVTGAVRVWTHSTAYNHCFLVLPLVAFLLWERRAETSSASPRPVLRPLLLMPFLSAVWLVAAVLDIQEGRQLTLVAMFEVVLLVALRRWLYDRNTGRHLRDLRGLCRLAVSDRLELVEKSSGTSNRAISMFER